MCTSIEQSEALLNMELGRVRMAWEGAEERQHHSFIGSQLIRESGSLGWLTNNPVLQVQVL